jgi:nicotinamidase-related amidase
MTNRKTAIVLIGYQNDYFAADGILKSAISESAGTNDTLQNTLRMVDALEDSGAILIQTPILFTRDYSELDHPIGILETIRQVGAFQEGSAGASVIPELEGYGERIITVPGKRGLNAFSNTRLHALLQDQGVEHVVLAGAVTSICIDSTGRSAHELGYRVSILSDCTAGRSNFEQSFYCEQVFPLYAEVLTSEQFLAVA